MPDGQRAAFACRNHQIVFAFEQESEGKGTFQTRQRFFSRLNVVHALLDVMLGQQGNGFRVRFGDKLAAMLGQLFAQFTVVFDNSVVNNGHRAGAVGVCVLGRRRAMGCPACVANAGLACQRFMNQQIGQVDQFADSATAVQSSGVHGGDAGAVVAAIFKPAKCFYQNRRNFMVPKNPHNSTHYDLSFWDLAFLAFKISNILVARPSLLS